MLLSRASLPAGVLAATLLGGCAAPPPPASTPPPASQPGTTSASDAPPSLLPGPVASGSFTTTGVVTGSFIVTGPARAQACDPGDPMAFDPGPRVDSLAILRVPGGWVAPMPNACPVDPRFRVEQPGRPDGIVVRGRSTPPPAPR